MTTSPILTTDSARTIAGLAIKRTSELTLEYEEGFGSFWTFYGQGGAGKTTLAASSSEVEFARPYLHIDAEGGMEAIKHLKNVDFVEVFNYRQFDRLVQQLKNGNHGFKAICVDNLCEIINMATDQVAKKHPDEGPTQPEWGVMTREILHMIRDLRDISRQQGVHVFICAWDADERDDRNVLKKDLAFTPKLREQYPGIVTTIGHLAVQQDPAKRLLSFAPSPRTVSKFRRAPTSNAIKIPFEIYYGLDNLPMPTILEVMRSGKVWPTAKFPQPTTTRTRSEAAQDKED